MLCAVDVKVTGCVSDMLCAVDVKVTGCVSDMLCVLDVCELVSQQLTNCWQ